MPAFLDAIRLILPLSQAKKAKLKDVAAHLDRDDARTVKRNLKLRRLGISYATLGVDKRFAKHQAYPQLNQAVKDANLQATLRVYNARIRRQAQEAAFKEFTAQAKSILPELIAPHLVGFDAAKKVTAWQLFSAERFHILLLGDPGTGKTDLLRAASSLAPISSFGLGSGTSGVGLVGAKKGKDFVEGLLPRAHKGICCLDELNLMQLKDRGSLLNAMEKGFVTYDKGSTHQQFPAEVRILATANPKGDRFIGNSVKFLREQLPFDPALLSRFHLVFFVRRPTKEEFRTITKSLLTKEHKPLTAQDAAFIKDYVAYAQGLPVAFDKKLEPHITAFFDDLKDREDDYLVELSPRLVLGVVRMAKAAARMQLHDAVTKDALKEVLATFRDSLKIGPDVDAKR